MKFQSGLMLLVASVFVSSASWADATPEECAAATEKFRGLSANVVTLLSKSYGYAVLPTIGKGGLGIGGAGGSGCVYAGGTQTGKVKMGQVTIGFQAGGQAFSQIIFFEDKATFDKFTSGEFEFGAQATAVALTAGVQAEAGTKGASSGVSANDQKSRGKAGNFTNGMAVFTVAKGGLMYEASIGGQKFGYEAL